MASCAIIGSQGPGGPAMTHHCGRKVAGVLVAGITLRGGWDMRARLGLGRHTVTA